MSRRKIFSWLFLRGEIKNNGIMYTFFSDIFLLFLNFLAFPQNYNDNHINNCHLLSIYFVPRCTEGFLYVSLLNPYNNSVRQVLIFTRKCSFNWMWQNTQLKRASQVAQWVKSPPAHAGDPGDVCSIPGSGRSPGAGNGNQLQYSCLENPKDRRAWQAIVHSVKKSRTQLSDGAQTHTQLKLV